MKLSNCLFVFICSVNMLNAQISSVYDTHRYLSLIEGQRVGLVVNHSSIIYDTHLIDSLINLNIQIKAIFSPEHGFFGNLSAGELFNNSLYNDSIPVISLYGKNKKPSNSSLIDIDLVIFDIQDVGVRFYTFISTLHYVMEACAENSIKLIVLDRPNLHSNYVDGPILNKDYLSFVGMHPVPIVYGMTIGEYASMINGERWISELCDLLVLPMIGYKRDSIYEFEVRPSPNLPNINAIALYPSLCLFEGTNVSVGRGTLFPFQHFGSPYLKSDYSFTPKSNAGSKNPKYENVTCFGLDLRNFHPYNDLNLNNKIELKWLLESYNNSPNKHLFFNDFFDKLAGSSKLRLQILDGMTIEEIKASWNQGILDFKKIRKRYLLYN